MNNQMVKHEQLRKLVWIQTATSAVRQGEDTSGAIIDASGAIISADIILEAFDKRFKGK